MTDLGDELYKQTFHKGKKAFQCTAYGCGKIIRFKSDMERHIIAHTDSKPFICTFPRCNKTFKREDALNNHLQSHSEELNFVCPMPNCSMRFRKKPILQYHITRHHTSETFPCDNPGCPKIFQTSKSLRRHKREGCHHSYSKKVKADNCEKTTAMTSKCGDFEFPAIEFDYESLPFDENSPRPTKVFHSEDDEGCLQSSNSEVFSTADFQSSTSNFVEYHHQPKSSTEEKLQLFLKKLLKENQEIRKKIAEVLAKVEKQDLSKS